MNEEGGAGDDADVPQRRPADREGQRTAGAALRRLFRALDRAGFDPHNDDDMDRYSEMLRRQAQTTQRSDRRSKRLGNSVIFIATGALTTLVVGFVSWLTQRIPPGWLPGGHQ